MSINTLNRLALAKKAERQKILAEKLVADLSDQPDDLHRALAERLREMQGALDRVSRLEAIQRPETYEHTRGKIEALYTEMHDLRAAVRMLADQPTPPMPPDHSGSVQALMTRIAKLEAANEAMSPPVQSPGAPDRLRPMRLEDRAMSYDTSYDEIGRARKIVASCGGFPEREYKVIYDQLGRVAKVVSEPITAEPGRAPAYSNSRE